MEQYDQHVIAWRIQRYYVLVDQSAKLWALYLNGWRP
jgi:hypothetical protein